MGKETKMASSSNEVTEYNLLKSVDHCMQAMKDTVLEPRNNRRKIYYSFEDKEEENFLVVLEKSGQFSGGKMKMADADFDLQVGFQSHEDFLKLINGRILKEVLLGKGLVYQKGDTALVHTSIYLLKMTMLKAAESNTFDDSDPTPAMNGHGNAGNEEEEEEDMEEEIARLRQQVQQLRELCTKIEVHSWIDPAQQLDIMARISVISLAFSLLYLYVKVVWWSFARAESWLYGASDQSDCTFLEASFACLIQKAIITFFKLLLSVLPIVHHYMYWNVWYRKLGVFATAFIYFARVKLCRMQTRLFAKQAIANIEEATDEDPSITNYGTAIDEDAIWDAHFETSARFLYASIVRGRGLWTKSAQYISGRADFMPACFVRELSRLHDTAPETPWRDVEKILKQEGVFHQLTDIERKPIASASIGQVHIARLAKTGEKVVVKVQHPSAHTLLTDDFASLKVIMRIGAILEPEYAFLEVVMGEWAKEAQNELNFMNEANNMKIAIQSLEKLKETLGGKELRTNPTNECPVSMPFAIEVPRPIEGMCTKKVLTMSFSGGRRVDDVKSFREWKLPRGAVMDGVAQSFALMLYVADIFNGDPHPGNILIRPGMGRNEEDGNSKTSGGFTVVILDWGLAKALTDIKRLAFCQLTYAAATFDFGLMLDGFKAAGLKFKREDVAEDLENLRFLLKDIAPREVQLKRMKAKMQTNLDRVKNKKRGERVVFDSKSYPGELFFFARTNELLQGLGSKLSVNVSYVQLLKPYAELGLNFHEKRLASSAPPQAPPEDQNDEELSRKIIEKLEDLKCDFSVGGAQVCVVDKDGKILSNVAVGHMGGVKKSLPIGTNAVVVGFSVTKAITSTVLLRLVDMGYLSYDEPICERIWPEFCPKEIPEAVRKALGSTVDNLEARWQWKRSITPKHVLTHSAGLHSSCPPKLTVKSMGYCEQNAAAFGYNPEKPQEFILPVSEPGTNCIYHYLSFGWIVSGIITRAYGIKHNRPDITYKEVYEEALVPLLSKGLLESGFFPCGGVGEFPKALTEADLDINALIQLSREAEAMGEKKGEKPEELEGTAKMLSQIRKEMKGREFLLDPRIWNCEQTRDACMPGASGRFSAKALALFFHEIGAGKILKPETLEAATAPIVRSTLRDHQAQANLTPKGQENDKDVDAFLGLGFQIVNLTFGKRKGDAFGHMGVAGSLGFYERISGVSIGIMLNKAGGGANVATGVADVITEHLNAMEDAE